MSDTPTLTKAASIKGGIPKIPKTKHKYLVLPYFSPFSSDLFHLSGLKFLFLHLRDALIQQPSAFPSVSYLTGRVVFKDKS